MDKFYYLITEGMKNVWRHKMTAFTAIISLFISLFIVGLLATAGDNTHKVLHYLRSKYKFEVFFKQDVSNEQAVGLIHQLKKIKGVRTATIIEKEDAVRIFKDQFGEDIIDILGYNPLPVSAVVNLSRTSRDLIRVEPIIKKIRSIGRVEDVRYQGNLIKKIERNYSRVIDRFPYLAGIVIILAVLIIYNTVKLSVYSRKELIRSLQMIGASRMFIKLPFIIEGVFIGLISSLLVYPALLGSVKAINYIFNNFTSNDSRNFWIFASTNFIPSFKDSLVAFDESSIRSRSFMIGINPLITFSPSYVSNADNSSAFRRRKLSNSALSRRCLSCVFSNCISNDLTISLSFESCLETLALAVFELDFLFDSFFNVFGTIHPK